MFLLPAAPAIVANPPTETFMAGSILSLSVISSTQPEAPPREMGSPIANNAWKPPTGDPPREMGAPREAWGSSPSRQLQRSASTNQYGQNLPFNPSHQYPPAMPEQTQHSAHHRQTRSANYQLEHNLPMQSGATWHGSEAQPMFQSVSASQQSKYEVQRSADYIPFV